ncbi:MAG: response regulator [Planctomycetes bacterium]|nr:response regulator [Planctomycetota bacterium]
MKREKILVIEDEPDIQELIQYNLAREGYRVLTAGDGETGLKLARQEAPSLIVLDLMLPGIDGIEVCRRLQADPATRAIAVVIVTAKGEESDLVLGLGVGADDYLTKPFSPRVLVARVRAVLRRGGLSDPELSSEVIQRGPLVIDALRHEVRVDGKPVEFTHTEFKLLQFLAASPGRVFPRDHLLSRVIGEDAIVLARNIDVHVRAVRQKLGKHRDLVQTVRGVGYRFRDERSRT